MRKKDLHDESNSLLVDIEENYVEKIADEHRRASVCIRETIEVINTHGGLIPENSDEKEKLKKLLSEFGFELEEANRALSKRQENGLSIHQKLAARISSRDDAFQGRDALLQAILMAEARASKSL